MTPSATDTNYQSRFFKSDRRGLVLSAKHRNHSTLNFGAHRLAGGEPFGALQFLNDLSMAPGHTIFNLQSDTILDVILPVTGKMTYNGFEANKKTVSPEQILLLNDGRQHAYAIHNEHNDGWLNYLHIGLKRNDVSVQKVLLQPVALTSLNTFASLNIEKMAEGAYGYTGVFRGRTKANYTLKSNTNGVFVYVINGAFEVEDRLLESRDGLALWSKNEISFEALSDHAILLVLEVPVD